MLNGILQIVKKFLFSRANKEFVVFLFFLALSGIFWLQTTLNEVYEREFAIPVSVTGIPKNAVLTSDETDTVRMTIRDKGITLLTYMYGDILKKVNVSFKTYAKGNGRGSVPVADLLKMFSQQLPSSSKVTSAKPEKIEFFFNDGSYKRVPVRFVGKVKAGQSYYISKVTIHPDSVMVYAADELLDSIIYASTEQRSFLNVTDTITTDLRLRSVRGAKFVPSTVSMSVYPDMLTEESVEVLITAVNMPEGKVLRTFPQRVKVLFVTGASVYRSIRPEQFSVEVDYNELMENPSEKCAIHLRAFPPSVRNAHTEIGQVDYLIEQQ
jgi:hypothetical protein